MCSHHQHSKFTMLLAKSSIRIELQLAVKKLTFSSLQSQNR